MKSTRRALSTELSSVSTFIPLEISVFVFSRATEAKPLAVRLTGASFVFDRAPDRAALSVNVQSNFLLLPQRRPALAARSDLPALVAPNYGLAPISHPTGSSSTVTIATISVTSCFKMSALPSSHIFVGEVIHLTFLLVLRLLSFLFRHDSALR